MPDSQSSEPGFESPFATVSKIGHFRSLHWRPCSLSCINEYLAIDSGGTVSDLVLAHNFCLARMLPAVGVGMNRSVREGKKCEVLWAIQQTEYCAINYLFFSVGLATGWCRVKILLRQLIRFGTLAIPFSPLCQCLSEETLKSVGVYARGSKRSLHSALECVTVVDSTTHS